MSSTTDASGKAKIKLTSTTTAAHNVVVSARVKDDQSYVNANKNVSFVTLTFAISPSNLTVVPDVVVAYNVTATPSDKSANIVFNENAGWSSNNTAAANIDVNGKVTANDAVATVLISASGVFRGLNYNVSTDLKIQGKITLGPYGVQNTEKWPDTEPQTFLIQAPDYQVFARCGSIVDSLGTLSGAVGGTGGAPITIKATGITSITTMWGQWNGDHGHSRLLQIKFLRDDGTSYTCGLGTAQLGPSGKYASETVSVPTGYSLVGVTVRSGPGGNGATPTNNYISQVSYIFAVGNE